MRQNFIRGQKFTLDPINIISSLYRPFIKKKVYFSKELNEVQYLQPYLFFNNSYNQMICFTDAGSQKPFMVLASNQIVDCHLVGAACAAQCLPLYRYDEHGNRIDNITDWGLKQFQTHYQDTTITKEDIFHYTYSVLHNPEYRDKYELNLKRDFPRLPFYDDFFQWVNWGKQLMELHINYETVEPYSLKRIDIALDKPKPKLKADKPNGKIILDDVTTLENVPSLAWEYRLGNRSALE